MPGLYKKNKQVNLLKTVRLATGLYDRMRGLLGTSGLPAGEGLWIHRCNSIHTFFMKYPIDCIFLDHRLQVVAVLSDVPPSRMTWPRWRAESVIELQAGQVRAMNLQKGEQLYVGD